MDCSPSKLAKKERYDRKSTPPKKVLFGKPLQGICKILGRYCSGKCHYTYNNNFKKWPLTSHQAKLKPLVSSKFTIAWAHVGNSVMYARSWKHVFETVSVGVFISIRNILWFRSLLQRFNGLKTPPRDINAKIYLLLNLIHMHTLF